MKSFLKWTSRQSVHPRGLKWIGRDYGIKTFPMTELGEGTHDVEIIEFFLQPGDEVKPMQPVMQVQTDKATADIPSPYAGKIVKFYHEEGDIAIVGDPIIDFEVEGEEDDEVVVESSSAPEPETSDVSAPTQSRDTSVADHSIGKVLTTPAVRRIARENNLDLTLVKPTGPKGRVLKDDVLRYLKGEQEPEPVQQPQITPTQAPPLEGDETIPIRGMKRAMVKTMNESNMVPTLTLMDDLIMDNLIKLRATMKPHAEKQNIRLSYMPFFIKAASMALKAYPDLNVTLNPEQTEITYRKSHNIGLAMDSPQGLVVPNIKNVQNLSILEIAAELNRLQEAGANGELTQEDLSSGTFTLSNIGAIGGTYATPLMSPPESAIIALGKMRKLAVFNEHDEVVPQNIVNMSLSADHRIIDGATCGRFINEMKGFLEDPEITMLLNLR